MKNKLLKEEETSIESRTDWQLKKASMFDLPIATFLQ